MKGIWAVAGCVAFLWLAVGACWGVESSLDWHFETDANPATPTAATNNAGGETAEIVTGYLSMGWMGSLSGFGTRTGLWDLGFRNDETQDIDTRGRVVLRIGETWTTNDAYVDLVLRVVQFVDGFIYTNGLALSIPGEQHVGTTVVEAVTSPPAKWVEDEYRWRLVDHVGPISLCITGAPSGTLLDRIRVSVVTPAVVVPELVITGVVQDRGNLRLSWTGGKPPYEVQMATNLVPEVVWSTVGDATSSTNVEIQLADPVGFVRVRASN